MVYTSRIVKVNNGLVATRLRTVAYNCEHDKPAIDKMGNHMRSTYRKRFKSAGAYAGSKPWAVLSKTTYMQHPRRMLGPGFPLMESGGLYRSYGVKGKPGNISVVRKHYARFGSQYKVAHKDGTVQPIAHLHEKGFTIPPRRSRHSSGYDDGRKVPARPVVFLGKITKDEMGEIMMDHIMFPYGRKKAPVDVP